jgi:hypothetical protein
MHERLLINADWLVIASSVAMLVLALLGILMGLPRFANTLSGWHKAMAWGVLPLIVLSPLTGLLIASGITFMSAPPPGAPTRGAPLRLGEAVRVIGEQHDLSALVWIRPQGGRVLARLVEGGEYRVYAVTPDGMTAVPRNWPRLWHEGNFAGTWSALLNLIASVAMIGLLVTGPLIWLRRRLQLRVRRLPQAGVPGLQRTASRCAAPGTRSFAHRFPIDSCPSRPGLNLPLTKSPTPSCFQPTRWRCCSSSSLALVKFMEASQVISNEKR